MASGTVGALLGAAATVGVAVFADSRDVINVDASPATTTVTVTTTVAPSPTTAAPASQGPSTPAPSTPPSDVVRQGELTLSAGYCADLESASPDWDVTSNCPGQGAINGRGDLRYLYRGIEIDFVNGSDSAVREDPAVDLPTCSAATAYARTLRVVDLAVGQAMCVRTSDDHHASLVVTALDAPDDDLRYLYSVTFSVTVWTT